MTLPQLTVPGIICLALAVALSAIWYVSAGRKKKDR
jgi:hypothetical protein